MLVLPTNEHPIYRVKIGDQVKITFNYKNRSETVNLTISNIMDAFGTCRLESSVPYERSPGYEGRAVNVRYDRLDQIDMVILSDGHNCSS